MSGCTQTDWLICWSDRWLLHTVKPDLLSHELVGAGGARLDVLEDGRQLHRRDADSAGRHFNRDDGTESKMANDEMTKLVLAVAMEQDPSWPIVGER